MEKVNSKITIEDDISIWDDNPLIMGRRRSVLTYLILSIFGFIILIFASFIFFIFGFMISVIIVRFIGVTSPVMCFVFGFILICSIYLLIYIVSFYFGGGFDWHYEYYIITDEEFIRTEDYFQNHEVMEKISLNDLEEVTFGEEKVSFQFDNKDYSFKCPDNMRITELQDKLYKIDES